MTWLCLVFVAAVLEEMISLYNVMRNYRYALGKRRGGNLPFQPKATLIVPCKGVDLGFEDNVTSFYRQAYDGYRLWFVVSETSDPAYAELLRIQQKQAIHSMAEEVRILVAGLSQTCSQKLHNLSFCCRQVPGEVQVIAFADSDIRVRPDWLASLVWPLRGDKVGVTTGYRWLVPDRTNLASLALSAINAKVVQMMGNTRWNLAWGGSMAVRKDVFRSLGVEAIWARALTDDLTLTKAVKTASLKVVFVPACVVPSRHSATWRSLWEFARRQFIIIRCYCPGTWWMALLGTALSVLEPWTAAALTVAATACQWTITVRGQSYRAWPFWVAVTGLLLACGFLKAVFRQQLGHTMLMGKTPGLRAARRADLIAFWLWPVVTLPLILASAFARTIRWRGIRYRLNGPLDIEVIPDRKAAGR